MTNLPRPVMIFGAGLGTRMAPLTETMPKPLIPVAGRPLLDHALELATGRPVVVNTHYLAEHMARHLRGKPSVQISHESELLETGGGLAKARALLDDRTCFTLNSDAVWSGTNPLDLLERAWQPEIMDALLLLVPRARAVGHVGHGDFTMTPSGALRRGRGGLVYTGAQLLNLTTLDTIETPVFSLNKVWDRLTLKDRLFGITYPGSWADVGTPQGIRAAEDMLRDKTVGA